MSRRLLAAATFTATALLVSGVVPLTGAAHAEACPSWTDPAKDFNLFTQAALNNLPGYANLDIVGASVATVGGDVVGSVTVDDLDEGGYTLAGDEFVVQLEFDGTVVRLVAHRSEEGVTGAVLPISGSVAGTATVTVDHNTSTVRIRATPAEIAKVAGKDVNGVAATVKSAMTATQVDGNGSGYDDAPAPEGTTFKIGSACSGGPADITVAWPQTDVCDKIVDVTDDGKATVAAATAPNDANLDIVDVMFNSTAKYLYGYIKVSQLGDKPANFQGDRFELTFKAGEKTFMFAGGRVALGKKVTEYPVRGELNGNPEPKLVSYAQFDKTKNTVVLIVDRAGLDLVNGSPIGDGTTVTGVAAKTVAIQGPQEMAADTAEHTDAAKRSYTFGDNPCFGPVPSKIAYTGLKTVQFGDVVTVVAKLTTDAGAVQAGKPVKFDLGTATATVSTNDAGVATTTLTPTLVAGTYNVVASFAGDAAAKAISVPTPFTVTQEKTKLTLTVKKSGTRRTVTAKLLDDDGKPVAGQVVAWYVNNKKVSSPRTTSAGLVTLTTAKPTQTVKALFTAVAGKYAGSTAQVKV